MRLVPIVGIKDRLIGFKNIAICPNIEDAKRGFANSIKLELKENDCAFLDPADLTLHHLADFDMDTGSIEMLDESYVLIDGCSIKEQFYKLNEF